jgi:hypothetical protein
MLKRRMQYSFSPLAGSAGGAILPRCKTTGLAARFLSTGGIVIGEISEFILRKSSWHQRLVESLNAWASKELSVLSSKITSQPYFDYLLTSKSIG